MRCLTILTISFALAVPAMAAQNEPSSNKETSSSQGKPYSPPPIAIVSSQQSPSSENQKRCEDKTQGWHKFVTFPEGVTAWAVILTLGAIIWQACESRTAAQFASESADAFMRSERAWVIATPEDSSYEIKSTVVGTSQGNGVIFSVRNAGKGIARIDSVGLNYRLLTEQEWNVVSENPILEVPMVSYNGRILVPTDSFPVGIPLQPNAILMADDVRTIEFGDRIPFAWGVIRYRDAFDNERLTRFGYKNHFPQGGRVGMEKRGFRQEPPGYNEAT